MEYTELRVHGIGGGSIDAVIGCEPDSSITTWRSEPSARSSVRHGPAGPAVRAYFWSPLTSGSRAFALWPLLLPFTLVNVAGWMGPAAPVRAWVHRVAATLAGLLMTALTVVWLEVAAVAMWDKVGSLPLIDETPAWDVGLGTVLALLAFGLLVLAATYAAQGYDRFRPSSWDDGPPEDATGGLEDERFYDGGEQHQTAWRVHLAIGLATWAATLVLIADRGAADAPLLLGRAVLDGTLAIAATVAVMVLVALPPDGRGRITQRLMGAAATLLGATLFGAMVVSVLLMVLGQSAMPKGGAVALFDIAALGLLAAVGCAAWCVATSLATEAPAEQPASRPLLQSVTARLRARLATVLSRVDLVVVGLGGALVVVGGWLLVDRWNEAYEGAWELEGSVATRFGQAVFGALLTFLVLNLWKSKASPDALRRIGNIWDILTFWPRTFQPFAVRPYAERAVPELREFIRTGPRRGPLVIAAHSQGAVLAYAALRPLARPSADGPGLGAPEVGLVTFGAPLLALYAAVFPRYVDAEGLAAVRDGILGDWQNVFRPTDHVGRSVFAPEQMVFATAGLPGDQPIPDGKPSVRGHNDYWTEPAVRRAVADSAARLEAAHG